MRSQAWLRALVLLLALLAPGVHTGLAATAAASAETAEHDVTDTVALRVPVRPAPRTAAPLRPAPLPASPAAPAAPDLGDGRRTAVPPRSPYATPVLDSVVLRC
ncbi:hypothetical protein GCM10020256_39350 [Streptomyces thermocoprophilus]